MFGTPGVHFPKGRFSLIWQHKAVPVLKEKASMLKRGRGTTMMLKGSMKAQP